MGKRKWTEAQKAAARERAAIQRAKRAQAVYEVRKAGAAIAREAKTRMPNKGGKRAYERKPSAHTHIVRPERLRSERLAEAATEHEDLPRQDARPAITVTLAAGYTWRHGTLYRDGKEVETR